jgi:hypothetical protein
MRLFGRKQGAEEQSPGAVYGGLRRQVLGLASGQLEGGPFADAPVLALLLETGYAIAVATLVAVVDGTSSLYFSNGGGFIGVGAQPAVAAASRRWLEIGRAFLPQLSTATDPPLPSEGMTQLIAVTPAGLRATAEPEEEFGKGRHALSPLFYAGQDVITQIRLTQGG